MIKSVFVRKSAGQEYLVWVRTARTQDDNALAFWDKTPVKGKWAKEADLQLFAFEEIARTVNAEAAQDVFRSTHFAKMREDDILHIQQPVRVRL